MKSNRRKFTTNIDSDVLQVLEEKAKCDGFGATNKVIESLTRNFIDYLDDHGKIQIKFYENHMQMPSNALRALLEQFITYMETETKLIVSDPDSFKQKTGDV